MINVYSTTGFHRRTLAIRSDVSRPRSRLRPTFFEEHCLSRFLRLESDPREDGAAYLIEREEKLSVARAFVLVDRMHADGSESPRWDVLSVRTPGGIFHPKIVLLVWHGWIRMMIGSANLTEPGYRRNQEVFGALDFYDGGAVPRRVLLECVDYLTAVLQFCAGSATEAGPKSRLLAFLENVRRSSSRWRFSLPGTSESPYVQPLFLGPLRGYNRSLLKQLGELIRERSGPAYEANVVSPFFDLEQDKTYPVTEELLAVLTDRGKRKVHYLIPCEELGQHRRRLKAPRSLIEQAKKPAEYVVWAVSEDSDGEFRPLHAKSIWLWNDNWHVYMVGSSNFTSAGMGLARNFSNFEANLAYVFRDSFSNLMEKTLPPYGDPIDDFAGVIWEGIDDKTGEEAVGGSILPVGFEEALFEPGDESSFLNLRFGDNLPPDWSIFSRDDATRVFSALEWASLKRPASVRLIWTKASIPNVLEVQWSQPDKEKQAAHWPVNVTEPGKLPPPDALRNLSLQTLLDILCSGRPLHEAVKANIVEESNSPESADIPAEPRPPPRFNSETFLLQRTRRVAKAIDQLVSSLSQPIVNRDALVWRLRGPVGPCALARAISKEAKVPGEACFLLSEIVLVLRRINTSKLALGIDRKEIDAAIASVIADITSMIEEQRNSREIPQAMVDYVSAALAQG